MYYPKTLSRFGPKIDTPITLKSLAADSALKLVVFSYLNPIPPPNGTSRPPLTLQEKKTLSSYLEENLPRTLHRELFDRAVLKWYGAERISNLMEILNKNCVTGTTLDLIGPFRYAYGCYYNMNRLYWSNGTIERLNLSKTQCDSLYKKITRGNPKKLRCISISTQKPALKMSKLPSILARGESLHTVVLLNGATDHILRIIGLNCHLLKLLDVSHSQSVTDIGMKNLLLRKPRQRIRSNTTMDAVIVNACALSISRIIILGTEITSEGQEFGSRFINGYAITFIPDSMMFKPPERQLTRGFLLESGNFLQSTKIAETLGIPQDEAEAIERTASRFVDMGPLAGGDEEQNCQFLDWFSDKEGDARLFIRLPGSRIPQAYLRMEWSTLTQLVLPWSSFTWRIPALPDVTELATTLPNLTVLKARLQGVWERLHEPMWPKLKQTYIWTIHDSTVISFLQHCPAIENFKFNCLDFSHIYSFEAGNVLSVLDDTTLQLTLLKNVQLRNSLVEISIRPAAKLTYCSVEFLIERCPNLLRLGDMESWNVTAETLKHLNKTLDRNNSKCVLTVLSFPPVGKPSYLL